MAERLGNEVIEFKDVSKGYGDRLLIDKRQLSRLADQHLARVGFLAALQHAKQRRFAGAVRADDADDGACGDLEA